VLAYTGRPRISPMFLSDVVFMDVVPVPDTVREIPNPMRDLFVKTLLARIAPLPSVRASTDFRQPVRYGRNRARSRRRRTRSPPLSSASMSWTPASSRAR